MKHTFSVLVENRAGVLSRITGLFSRRAFNIESLAVGVTEDPTFSRVTIVVEGNENLLLNNICDADVVIRGNGNQIVNLVFTNPSARLILEGDNDVTGVSDKYIIYK